MPEGQEGNRFSQDELREIRQKYQAHIASEISNLVSTAIARRARFSINLRSKSVEVFAARTACRVPAAVDRSVRIPRRDGGPPPVRHSTHADHRRRAALSLDARMATDLPAVSSLPFALRGRVWLLAFMH